MTHANDLHGWTFYEYLGCGTWAARGTATNGNPVEDSLDRAKRGEVFSVAVAMVKSYTQEVATIKWSSDSVALLDAVQHLAFSISENLSEE